MFKGDLPVLPGQIIMWIPSLIDRIGFYLDGDRRYLFIAQDDYTREEFADLFQQFLDEEYGTGLFTVGYDENHYFYILHNNPDPDHMFFVENPDVFFDLFVEYRMPFDPTTVQYPHLPKSAVLTLELDGTVTSVTLDNVVARRGTGSDVYEGAYDFTIDTDIEDFLEAFNADLEAAFGKGVVTASVNGSKELVLHADGAASIKVISGENELLSYLGLTSTTETPASGDYNTSSASLSTEKQSPSRWRQEPIPASSWLKRWRRPSTPPRKRRPISRSHLPTAFSPLKAAP